LFVFNLNFIFKDHNSILHNLLRKQITHLNVDFRNEKASELSEISSNIFLLILSLCQRLIHLNICRLFSYRNSSICISKLRQSSSLTKLKINVSTFDDCLYLLDGKLNHLSKLIINVNRIKYSLSNINNSVKVKFQSFLLFLEEFCLEKASKIKILLIDFD
jgi:hypothetical protein